MTSPVFIDDDILFTRGSWQEMEDQLLVNEPAIGVPNLPGYWRDHCMEPRAVYSHDAIYSAIHREVIEEGLILPYITRFDNRSWFASQLLLIHLAHFFYPRSVVRFGNICVVNNKHRDYLRCPPGCGVRSVFNEIEKWLLHPGNVFSDVQLFREQFVPHFESLGITFSPRRMAIAPDERRHLLRPYGNR